MVCMRSPLLACAGRAGASGSGRFDPGRPRSAAASAVMSMAAGHHVTHRPHPTQPEDPNWSCQDASLCVIHCR